MASVTVPGSRFRLGRNLPAARYSGYRGKEPRPPAISLTVPAREMARLAFSGLVGTWRKDPAVSLEFAERGWATMRRSIPSILDGETQKLPRRAEFEFVPRASRALAPRTLPAASL